ncbi:MAG TPA: hypothetical protein VKC90_03805 [Chitinophagaceae bacterium]|nr:hypothetical protein [Chitinophagaceae bacterium]
MKPDSINHKAVIDIVFTDPWVNQARQSRDANPSTRLFSISTRVIAENPGTALIEVFFNYHYPAPNMPEDVMVRVEINKTTNQAIIVNRQVIHFP